MSMGAIPEDNVYVTVKRREGQGRIEYVSVDRVHRATISEPKRGEGKRDNVEPRVVDGWRQGRACWRRS